MRISAIAALALALCAGASTAATAPAYRFTPAPAVQPSRIVALVRNCRRLSIVGYRTADMSKLDAYVAELFKDQARNRDEILACGAYLVGATDAGFYMPDPK